MRDIDDFDLDRSIDEGWEQFVGRLSEVLSVMDEGAELTLSTLDDDPERARVVFTSPALGSIRVRVTGVAAEELDAAGWGGDDGQNAWSQDHTDELAGKVVSLLRNVIGVTHPVLLTTDDPAGLLAAPALRENGTGGVTRDEVSSQEAAVAILARDQAELEDLVSAQLAAVFGRQPLRDSDGDHAIRVGSTMVFVRVVPDCREIIVFAPLVHDIAGRSRAAEVLNDLNAESRWVRFALIRDRVFGSMSVLARPFVPAHLQQAVRELADVADAIDDNLADTLKGRTTF